MLNYWVMLGLLIVLTVMSVKVDVIKGWGNHQRQLAVIDENIQKLKLILFFAWCLMVFVWGSIFYVAACIIKFIISLF